MNDRWILAKVSDGLFPNERTAQFQTDEGEVSVFVSSNQIDVNTGRLKVLLLEEDANFALVQVPSHGGGTVAKVRRADLASQQ